MNAEEFNTGVIRPIECFKEAWELIKPNYWILFAISIVGAMIAGMSMYILLGAAMCGIFFCFFQVIDGEEPEFEGLLKGINFFKPSFLVMLVFVVPMIAVLSLIYIPFIIAALMGPNLSGDELIPLLIGTLAVEFVVATIMVCLHTLLMFAFPLIVDRNLTGLQAMKLSAKAVWKNLSGVAGLWAISFILALIGYMLLCIGIYFTIPIIIAGNVVAYRKVFPSLNPPGLVPSPPGTYPKIGGRG